MEALGEGMANVGEDLGGIWGILTAAFSTRRLWQIGLEIHHINLDCPTELPRLVSQSDFTM